MFSINVIHENNQVFFTIVKPDTTYMSGQRDTLAEVWALVEKEMKWREKQQKRGAV